MLTTYLSDAALPQGSRVFEVGCGTGAVIRSIAKWPGVSAAVGFEPSPAFVANARELARDLPSLTFETADGRPLPFGAASFDAVVFHTTLCHVPEPKTMLDEAVRVLRPGGCVAVFEADYATATLATRTAGLQIQSIRSHGYVEALAPGFMLGSWVDMGADALVASGRAHPSAAAELKVEARRRLASGEYFGHIAYLSLVARKSP